MNLRTWLQSRLSRPSKPRHPVMKPRLQVEPLESRVVPDCELGAVELVRDINTNGVSSNPAELVEINGIVFFTANDGVNGQELWKSDGTAAGTVMVKDITPGSGSSSPHVLTRVGNTLFFNAAGGLWKSDGTEAGTVFVKAVAILNDFPGAAVSADVGGTLFFLSDVPHPNHELWKSDGTEAGTVLVATLPVTSSVLGFLTAVNGTLFFRGDGADGTGQELWKSDGTAAGTVLVKDINPGSSGSSPSELTNVGGTLYFRATTATNGIELEE